MTLEENVRIMENAVVRGPCYIGKNSVIGNNVLIREGVHIGDDCVVGFSTEIKHSYIGDRCWFHSNYIGDSIIADRCSFGAGTITANLRFDEEEVTVLDNGRPLNSGLNRLGAIIGADSKTGVNVSIPGLLCYFIDIRASPHGCTFVNSITETVLCAVFHSPTIITFAGSGTF